MADHVQRGPLLKEKWRHFQVNRKVRKCPHCCQPPGHHTHWCEIAGEDVLEVLPQFVVFTKPPRSC